MYKVTLKNIFLMFEYKELLAENHEDLRAIVTLAPEVGYEILTVKPTMKSLQTVSEFLEENKDKLKPKDLVFGTDTNDTYSDGNLSNSEDVTYPPKVQSTPTKNESEEKSNQKED